MGDHTRALTSLSVFSGMLYLVPCSEDVNRDIHSLLACLVSRGCLFVEAKWGNAWMLLKYRQNWLPPTMRPMGLNLINSAVTE